MLKRFILTLFVSIMLFGCVDNVLEGTGDKNSSQAQSMKLEIALNEKNFQYIIDVLDNKSNRSEREDYLLQIAKLGYTGFTVLDIFDLFDDDLVNAGTIFTKALGISSEMTTAELIYKREYYKAAKQFCLDDQNSVIPTTSNDTSLLCGFAATADIIVSLAEIAADVNGGKISFDQNSPDYFVIVLEAALVTNPTLLNDQDLIDTANTSLDLIVDLAGTLSAYSGGTGIDTSINDLVDQLTDSTGKVTAASLEAFLGTL